MCWKGYKRKPGTTRFSKGSCVKASPIAKRKFKVWPSAYASGWGVRCTRNPRKFLKR